ncbi:aspartate aminotransferase [Nakamurella panacisegetis]|uniref:Aspartate aminotransferase n=1 Tax=Nakamurella panacisegetis TaxID=1090615 RepID=A0A1H0SUE6_9ACTN|nr:aminotransferase class V-fold PLP-dependent enzyme [Nakamurella panacisegetis]SDP44888.1 aspartate aminotransferase [Nakamurella panacisegetis]
MTTHPTPASLLDLEVVGPSGVVAAEAALANLLGTTHDVLLVQAEAIVALEATAKGLGRPGVRALNVVTGPYGALFGRWLAATGAAVTTLEVPFHRAVTAADVAAVLASDRFDLVALVHAEAATGSANPLDEIAPLVVANGALLVVDAVASIGGHPVTPDEWGADVVVIGAQKALAGPAGVSALSISPRAWAAMAGNPGAPRESILSLLDLRDGWLRSDRAALLGTPSSLETTALNQALARVEQEGLGSVISRHRAAAAASRAGLRQLGLTPWIADDHAAATVVTTFAGTGSIADLVTAARAAGARFVTAAPGVLASTTGRINHTGRAADLDTVLDELRALGDTLGRPTDPVTEAARRTWAATI